MHTISLCMIVKDEQEVIERCLNSIQSLVDEIIIVDTGSKENTVELCKKYTSSIFYFEWCDDFAKARNFSFQQATCEYIIWLDADDIIEPEQLAALMKLKTSLHHDVYFLKYDYSQDEYGQSTCSFFRERIIRNDKTFQWIYPIHEVIDGTNGRDSSYVDIYVKHQRTKAGHTRDHERNLKILAKTISHPDYITKPRIWYYYGRELFDHARYTEAINTFTHFASLKDCWIEELVIAYFKMGQCYLELYRCEKSSGNKDYDIKAREMARMAIKLDGRWAEPYFVLGQVAFETGQFDEAIFWFNKCLRPIPEVLSPVNLDVYGIDTYVSLMFCYDKLHDYVQSNYYNEQALKCKPKDAGLLHNRNYFKTLLNPISTTHKYKIAWYGSNVNPNFPSYRIRAIQMNKAINELGFHSEMIGLEPELNSFDCIIFFKGINEQEFRTMERMKAMGKKVVFEIAEDLCGLTADFPYYIPMIELADLITCCSHALAGKIQAYNSNAYVIEDAVEPVHCIHEVTEKDNLTIGWIGMPGNAKHPEKLRPLIESMGHKLVNIHNGQNCDKYWTLDDWQDNLIQCDVAIAPINVTEQPCKSNNKITTYQSLGIPVIAAPLDAYLRIIKRGKNGLIAASEEEWQKSISQMNDTAFRNQLQKGGLATAMHFRPKNMALKLIQAISPETFNKNAVDIIIPTIYNAEHIQICIDSILACTQVPFNIIVVNNGSHELNLPPEIKVIKADHLNFSASVNLGIEQGTAPFICIMNDDVIVSDGWLTPLLDSIKNGIAFCNPLSNSDKGSLHHYEIELEGIPLGAGTNVLSDGLIVERSSGKKGLQPNSIYNFSPVSEKRQYRLGWVPFFCTLTSRTIIEQVGLLDDAFDNGCEDLDLCTRAHKIGFSSGVNENSFVFHFGGTSVDKFIEENPEQRGVTHRIYHQKYEKPLLVIHAGYAYEAWNGNTIKCTGIGGSETAAAKIAESFCNQGYWVVVFCECNGLEGVINGVTYKCLNSFKHFVDRHFIDIFVLSRYANFLEYRVRAKKKYFWMHDMCALGTEAGENDLLRKHIHELDGIFCLSPWHKDSVQKTHEIPEEKLFIIGNGIDPNRFSMESCTIPNQFIYSSSPDRSLDILLRLFPKIRAILPDATLHIYYGFDNWDKSIQQSGNITQLEFRNEIMRLTEQEGVYYHGRVDQDKLAQAFAQSDIWLYPTRFTETYCISALEAQMSETLCICSDLAGLSSTVADRGILIQKDPSHPDYEEHIIEQLLSIQNDPDRKRKLLDKAKSWAQSQSWDAIAKHWNIIFDPSTKLN